MMERRKNRSPFKDQALRSWLEAVVQRSGCKAMTVADDAGFAAAGTDDERMDTLAGVAAVHAAEGREIVVAFEDSTMVIRTMQIERYRIVVAAIGTVDTCRHALEEAGWGVRRILG